VRLAVKRLSQNGKTILLTTHLLEEADQLCSRVAFIVNGAIVANDTPQNLKLSHGTRSLEVILSDLNQPDHLSQLILSMDETKDQQRLVELMSQGNVRSVHSQEATLEEVFIEVAGIRPA
jgi:ABC-2 type transport system ATP-binding protein